MNFEELLRNARNEDNSDIHFKVGTPPVLRRHGHLVFCETERLSKEDIDKIVEKITDKSQREQFKNTQELDFAFDLPGTGRFRANLYREKGNTAIALRLVSEEIKTIEELNLPMILKEWALKSSGLILCTGTAGSGKSTTIAAMLEHINQNVSKNIITIMSLYKKDLITHKTAIQYVTNVDDFERKLHGIKDEQFVT